MMSRKKFSMPLPEMCLKYLGRKFAKQFAESTWIDIIYIGDTGAFLL